MKKIALIAIISILLASISVVQFNTVVHASPDYEYVKPTAFTDPGDRWISEGSAYDSADPNETTTYASGEPNVTADPSVTFSTWGTKFRAYTATDLYVNWATDAGWSDDTFAIRYTDDGGASWYDVVPMGLHNETAIQQSSVTLATADQDLTQVQVKVAFIKSGGGDKGFIYIYDIWTRGTYTPPTWGSYTGGYPGEGGTAEDVFADYPADNIAYMYGTGFVDSITYRVIFWDGGGANVQLEDKAPVGGVMKAEHTFVGGDAEGDWNCAVYKTGANPGSYLSTDTDIIADDTSYNAAYAFHMDATAIPEFPTIMAGIAVAGLCFGIYYWMRKRRLVYVKG